MKTAKLAIVCALAALLFTTSTSADLLQRSVDVDGVTRQYLVYLPVDYDGSERLPVMLAYHGGGGNAFGMLFLADFRPFADEDNFIAVYPQGLPENGDSGPPIWNSEGPFSNGVDEIGYTAAMLDALDDEFEIDETRVYATGYSNGANLAWELACLLSDRITAVAPVAGSMWTWTETLCAPTRPVPVVSIHGTRDFYNPYDGGPPFSLGLIEASEYWARHNGTDREPIILDVPNNVPGDGSTVDLYAWANGEDCVSVEHYKVQNGGHDWPGVFGNMDIDSTEVIWRFVSRYDMFGLRSTACNK